MILHEPQCASPATAFAAFKQILPRKINIALSPSRDDFPYTHINDVGLQAGKDPNTGEVSV